MPETEQLDPIFEQFNKIDQTHELTTALEDAGFEFVSTTPSVGGAILSESWVHPTHGGFGFSYEYGSKIVAREEDYVNEDLEEVEPAIEERARLLTGLNPDNLKYLLPYENWTLEQVCQVYQQTETAGVGTAYDLLSIAYESTTGIGDLPETSDQTVGGFLSRVGFDLEKVESAYPKLTPEEYLIDVRQEGVMQQISNEGSISFEDEAGSVVVATLETMPGQSKPDLLVASGQTQIDHMVAVRDPEANPQKVRQAFDRMGLLKGDIASSPADPEKAEIIRGMARDRAVRSNRAKNREKESGGIEL